MRCLINFAYLDPPINGGTSRVAREIAHGILSISQLHVTFLVRARFATQFEQWLNADHVRVLPYSRLFATKLIVRLAKPDVIVSPLFGVEPFHKVSHIPQVVSLPDTLVIDHPELFSPELCRLSTKCLSTCCGGEDHCCRVALCEVTVSGVFSNSAIRNSSRRTQ